MSIASIRQLVDDCYEAGQHWYQPFRKVPAITTAQGYAIDLSMAPGNPRPNYYTGDPLTAKLFTGAYGIWHGGDVSPKTKYLHRIMALATSTSVVPVRLILMDYLLFYPLIDMDSSDEQYLDNTVTLPRYTDGEGVQACLIATNPYIGGAYFYLNYTNQNGTSGRISKFTVSNTATYISTVVHSGIIAGTAGPFMPLLTGDFVRSVESITFLSPNGGLATLVLCRPIAELYIRDTNAPAEWDFLTMQGKLPQIYDGAYLNFLAEPNGSVAAQYIIGDMTVIWA